jgi:hypothetical protein
MKTINILTKGNESHFHLGDPMSKTTKRRIAAAAFAFFLVKGLVWLAAGTGIALAAR